jgi:hypothetical protein
MNGMKLVRSMIANVYEFTVEKAKEALRSVHPNQRNVIPARVDKWLRVMQSGGWIEDSEPISFDIDGRLINGQNRLSALVKFGKPLNLLVVEGHSHSAIEGMDRGCIRTLADRSRVGGHLKKDDKDIYVSVARIICMIDEEVVSYLKAYREDIAAVRGVLPRNGACSTCACAAALSYARPMYPEQVMRFARKLVGEEEKYVHDPADKLIESLRPGGSGTTNHVYWTFCAFDKSRLGKQLQAWPKETNLPAAMVMYREKSHSLRSKVT